jgi:HEAT repeat protein
MPCRLGRSLIAVLLILSASHRPLVAEETEPTSRSVDALVAALKDTTPETRIQAIVDLAERGEAARPAIPPLIDALRDQDSRVRMVAAMCLGQLALEPKSVMPALETAMEDTEVSGGRQVCVVVGLALGAYGKPAMPHLRRALASDQVSIRRGALAGLYRVGPPAQEAVDQLIEMLQQGDPELRGFLHEALIGIGPGAKQAVPALIESLSSDDFHTQYWACRVLGAIGPEAQPATEKLIELVQTGVTSVRHNAATALGDIGPSVGPKAVQALTEAFSFYSQTVRNKAVIALGKLQPLSISAAPKIEELLCEPAKFSPRANAARVLYAMRPEAEEVVVKALLQDLIASEEPHLAAHALAEIDFECDIVQRIIPLLEAEKRYTRQYAVIALGNMGLAAADAEDALTELLQDEAEEVREDAETALEKITGQLDKS